MTNLNYAVWIGSAFYLLCGVAVLLWILRSRLDYVEMSWFDCAAVIACWPLVLLSLVG